MNNFSSVRGNYGHFKFNLSQGPSKELAPLLTGNVSEPSGEKDVVAHEMGHSTLDFTRPIHSPSYTYRSRLEEREVKDGLDASDAFALHGKSGLESVNQCFQRLPEEVEVHRFSAEQVSHPENLDKAEAKILDNALSSKHFVEQHLEGLKQEGPFDLDPRPRQYHNHTPESNVSSHYSGYSASSWFTTEADLTPGQECLGHVVEGWSDVTGAPRHLAYYYRQETDGVMVGYQDGGGTTEILQGNNGTLTVLRDKQSVPS